MKFYNSLEILAAALSDTMSSSMFTTMAATLSTSMCINPISFARYTSRCKFFTYWLDPEGYFVLRIFITMSATSTFMSIIMSATWSTSINPHQFGKVSVWSGMPEGFESNTVSESVS